MLGIMRVWDILRFNMTTKKQAIMQVRCGVSISSVCQDSKGRIKASTLKRWLTEYKRPDEELIIDMMAEAIVSILSTNPRGADLNGVVNAMKMLSGGSGSTQDIMDMLDAQE